VNLDRIGFDQTQIRIHRFDDTSDPLSGLVRVDDPSMLVVLSMDEREEVVVESKEDSIVFDRERELFLVGRTEQVLLSGGVSLPTTLAETVRDSGPNTLVAVNRPTHAVVGPEGDERSSSMCS
jgi:hypothetical protein